MTETSDPRHADLYVSAATFLHQHDLHPDPATYLAHGYIDLCLAAWPSARGPELDLAVRWALWTWLADDLFDVELRHAELRDIAGLAACMVDILDQSRGPALDDHPIVLALADLTAQTRPLMPSTWWERYRAGVEAWLHAAAETLLGFSRPDRTPTLREYLGLRPDDGGMLLAAMWTELAEQCVTPDWSDPLVQSLLGAFSACGYLLNDLAPGAGTFTAPAALTSHGDMAPDEARLRAVEWLRGEERRLWILITAVRTGGFDPATVRLATGLERFRHALTRWTAASSRYVLAAPAVTE